MVQNLLATPRAKASDAEPDADMETRYVVLQREYEAVCSAFYSWETAQARTDQHLYMALGRLAEFAAAVGNDHASLIAFAAGKGIKATKVSTPFTVTARLMVPDDRKKASKYAMVLQLAARKGIVPICDTVAAFIKAEGGIEACLRSFRSLPRESIQPRRGGRPSAFGRAVERIGGIDRITAPSELELGQISGDYFLVVGVRNPDGTTQLLRHPVTDSQTVRKAVASLAPKG